MVAGVHISDSIVNEMWGKQHACMPIVSFGKEAKAPSDIPRTRPWFREGLRESFTPI